MRVKDDVDCPGVFVLAQDFLPGRAAIAGPKDATFVVWSESVANGGNENNIRVGRVNDKCADMIAVFQSDIAPVTATID
jgi:hypothetical protein